ncbi:unnamed protein product [Medioppia subpectinata]|uniref:WH1 domain-containing protein n=1 Tax=Medioppia subpectinata TaxID=1979941 RepID=A0A7R9KGU1_9ACAR|nr:unnamed protein product [Medioppia subpectinata]CAG2102337.1 unnamed protein product [Medioppia subpectinata]
MSINSTKTFPAFNGRSSTAISSEINQRISQSLCGKGWKVLLTSPQVQLWSKSADTGDHWSIGHQRVITVLTDRISDGQCLVRVYDQHLNTIHFELDLRQANYSYEPNQSDFHVFKMAAGWTGIRFGDRSDSNEFKSLVYEQQLQRLKRLVVRGVPAEKPINTPSVGKPMMIMGPEVRALPSYSDVTSVKTPIDVPIDSRSTPQPPVLALKSDRSAEVLEQIRHGMVSKGTATVTTGLSYDDKTMSYRTCLDGADDNESLFSDVTINGNGLDMNVNALVVSAGKDHPLPPLPPPPPALLSPTASSSGKTSGDQMSDNKSISYHLSTLSKLSVPSDLSVWERRTNADSKTKSGKKIAYIEKTVIKQLEALVGDKCHILSVSFLELFLWAPYLSTEWHVCRKPVLCLVSGIDDEYSSGDDTDDNEDVLDSNNSPHYSLRMYELNGTGSGGRILWESSVDTSVSHRTPDIRFQALVTDDCMAGLVFESVGRGVEFSFAIGQALAKATVRSVGLGRQDSRRSPDKDQRKQQPSGVGKRIKGWFSGRPKSGQSGGGGATGLATDAKTYDVKETKRMVSRALKCRPLRRLVYDLIDEHRDIQTNLYDTINRRK